VRLRLLGVLVAWVSAELQWPDGRVRRGGALARRIREEESTLRFGPATIEGARLTWTTTGLSGDLEMAPRHPAVVLCDPVFADGKQLVRWWVEVPDADVRGTLTWPGGGGDVRGRGYRDRVIARAVPWRFPMRRLLWGHASAGNQAAVWFEAETKERVLSAGWENGRVNDLAATIPELEQGRVVLDERLGERLAGRVRVLRSPLRRLTSDPHQTRWASGARLMGEAGRAVYEEVRWG
jgi:hypothetical protein